MDINAASIVKKKASGKVSGKVSGKKSGKSKSETPAPPPIEVIPGRYQGTGDDASLVVELKAMDLAAQQEAVTSTLARVGAAGGAPERLAAARDLAVLVRTFGLMTLTQMGILENLQLSLTEASATVEAKEGALFAVKALSDDVGAWFEPFALPMLPSVLQAVGAKGAGVQEAAAQAAKATVLSLNPRAARLCLPTIFEAMESPEWKVKLVATNLIGVLAGHSTDQLNVCMPLIVPRITTCLRDTKKEVSSAAKKALTAATNVCGNPDILPVVPAIIAAIKNPDKTPEALDDLMHTTFVHQVDASSLAVIVPILARSLADRGMHPKRKTAMIVVNMCKLVLNPLDVEPFAPKLLPELKRCGEDASFEEIRDICKAAADVLERKMAEALRQHDAMNGPAPQAAAAAAEE